jgi:hypothetical protein
MSNVKPPASFEDRLLEHLQEHLPDQSPARRSRWAVAAAAVTAVATAVAAAAAVVGIATAQPAYAIETASDGALLITFNSTDAKDVARAEADLQRRGVRIELVAATHDCLGVLGATPLPTPPHPLPSGPPSRENMPALYAFDALPRNGTFAVRPDVIPAGHTLWVAIADNDTNLVTVADFRPVGSPQPEFCA